MGIYTESDFQKDKAEKGSAFNSLYEKMQALEGSSGNRAAHVAAQETHSKGLRAKGLPDTSIFGTNRDLFGRDRFETQDKNPMFNYRAQPKIPTSPQINQMLADQAMGIGGAPTGGFFPSLAGPGRNRNPRGFIETMVQSGPGMREAFGMGLANIASGGAFSSDPNVKMTKFIEQGFGADQAQRYLQDTARTNARLEQDRFVYGDRINERGTQGTQATAATGEVDPTADPNYIPPHLRYLMEQREAVANMNMGGLMALGPMMQQQQYEMGRQMAMRDMGVSV